MVELDYILRICNLGVFSALMDCNVWIWIGNVDEKSWQVLNFRIYFILMQTVLSRTLKICGAGKISFTCRRSRKYKIIIWIRCFFLRGGNSRSRNLIQHFYEKNFGRWFLFMSYRVYPLRCFNIIQLVQSVHSWVFLYVLRPLLCL